VNCVWKTEVTGSCNLYSPCC